MRVVVVGGGITGLAVAWFLRHGVVPAGTTATAPDDAPVIPPRPDLDVLLLEADDRLGGKILTVPFARRRVDVGADAFLARRPQAVRLARRLGLGERLVAPRTGTVWMWVRGRLRPLPDGTVFGVPGDLVALARSGVLTLPGLARAVAEPLLGQARPHHDDESVADLVGRRFGREVVDTLVEPLLGGVYAGRADRLSAQATTPMLVEAARDHRTLTGGVRAFRRRAAAGSGPVFLTVEDGLQTLVDAIVRDLGAGSTRTRAGVTGLARTDGVWQVRVADGSVETADAVVLAVPAPQAAGLLADVAPDAAEPLRSIPYASVATISLAYDRAAASEVPDGSGMLVPRSEGRLIKAATWTSFKWPHHDHGDRFLVRASVGRVDDAAALALAEGDLVERVEGEVRAATGLTAAPVDTRVTRWWNALPQYEVGHLDRVAAVRGALEGTGLHLAGAAYDGIGVAPCIAQAEEVARVLTG